MGELAHAAGAAAQRVLEHIRIVSEQSTGVAASIEATSTALVAVSEATRRIEETVTAQRTATQASEATLTAATERLVQIAERRAAPRVALETSVRAVLVGDDGRAAPVETVTIDLSMGGALLKSHPALGAGPWQLQLFLPRDPEPLRCSAKLARETRAGVGVAFTDVRDADLLRLDHAITSLGRPVR